MIDPSFPTGMIEPLKNTQQGSLKLFQNQPNPVKDQTEVKLQLDRKQYVSLELLDMQGKRINTFINSELQPGTHTFCFDLRSLESGMYCYGTGNHYLKLIKN
ncbi:MAG: T9SS type A sorting domain-containing protein [Bacteroidales bacterium]|nr:T9SS type A sorting domain-containing protein [Bacteroidales bacterium]